MEERRGAVLVPFSLGNLVFNYLLSVERSCMDVMNLDSMADEAGLLPDAEMKSLGNSLDSDNNDDCSFGDSGSDVSFSVALGSGGESRSEGSSLMAMTSEDETLWLAPDVVVRESEEDGSSSLEGDAMPDSCCSLSVVSDTSSLCGDDFLNFEANFLDQEKSLCDVELVPRIEVSRNPRNDAVAESSGSKSSKTDAQSEKGLSGRGGRSIFEVDCVPLWGLTSVCGRRPEMEDAVATLPRFLKIPIEMLTSDHGVDGVTTCLSHVTGHFFGVYDGHGGAQVHILFFFVFDHTR